MERSPWVIERGPGPVIATAIHQGHDLRPEVASWMRLSEAERLREEDPHTGELARVCPARVLVDRSRFEVDLNRPVEEAVCLSPDDCWGLEVWAGSVPERILRDGAELHGRFYDELGGVLEEIERREGRFVVLDLHSYNHRRGGPGAAPADPRANPEVNVGTGSLPRVRWGALVDRFLADLRVQGLDARENVRFRGRHLAAFVHSRFPETGCCLAIELKKTFMDEHSGALHPDRLAFLRAALSNTLPGLRRSLDRARAA